MLRNSKNVPLVLFNEFSAVPFDCENGNGVSPLSVVAKGLNAYVRSLGYSNIVVINIEDIYFKLSIDKSLSYRDYMMTKSLYTIDFFKEYSSRAVGHYQHISGSAKKCIVFDCDNTLWGGILGEDGVHGIEMSKTSIKGRIFEEVQILIKFLIKQGVMVCICTKNNMSDIENVFYNHKDLKIKIDDLVAIKANWDSKVSNLQGIASELNIGLDSMVFVDDSDYEINLVRRSLPEIMVLQVPKKIHNYAREIKNLFSLFDLKSLTQEDLTRTVKYKEEEERKKEKNGFDNIDDYIESLEILINLSFNCMSDSLRLSQLTQKTNQFNFTTKRYAVADIESFIESNNHNVVSVSVNDKYGDYGLTGLIIFILGEDGLMEVDTFLLSCRVLGRHVERCIVDYLTNYAIENNIKEIDFKFEKTKKNHPAESFLYDHKSITKKTSLLYSLSCGDKESVELSEVIVER